MKINYKSKGSSIYLRIPFLVTFELESVLVRRTYSKDSIV